MIEATYGGSAFEREVTFSLLLAELMIEAIPLPKNLLANSDTFSLLLAELMIEASNGFLPTGYTLVFQSPISGVND